MKFSVRSMKSLLREEGAKSVSLEYEKKLGQVVEEFSRKIARRAVKNALLSGRKSVKGEDIIS